MVGNWLVVGWLVVILYKPKGSNPITLVVFSGL